MENSTSVPDDGVSDDGAPNDSAPNAGQAVSDSMEPEEEYELDQVTDERDGHGGESLAERLGDEPHDRGQG